MIISSRACFRKGSIQDVHVFPPKDADDRLCIERSALRLRVLSIEDKLHRDRLLTDRGEGLFNGAVVFLFQTDAVKNAQKIFYYLLEHHELREENAPALYKAYIEQNEVQELVKSQADIADCSIAAYSGVIYLIPNEDNYFLGYSKGQMKKELCRSGATDKDY